MQLYKCVHVRLSLHSILLPESLGGADGASVTGAFVGSVVALCFCLCC